MEKETMNKTILSTYSSDLLKTAALIPETLELLHSWEPGIRTSELARRIISAGALGRVSAERVKDIIQCSFSPRFLKPNDIPARIAKTALQAGLPRMHIRELLFLFYLRTNRVAWDFLVARYWPASYNGKESISNKEIEDFLRNSFGTPQNPRGWSEKVTLRLAQNLSQALSDFGLFEYGRTSIRKIRPWQPSDFLVTYVLLDAVGKGIGNTSLLSLPEWKVLGLNQEELISRCRKLGGFNGPFLFQYSGELAQFSWKYHTLEELIHEQANAE
jgi:hypothetical protein